MSTATAEKKTKVKPSYREFLISKGVLKEGDLLTEVEFLGLNERKSPGDYRFDSTFKINGETDFVNGTNGEWFIRFCIKDLEKKLAAKQQDLEKAMANGGVKPKTGNSTISTSQAAKELAANNSRIIATLAQNFITMFQDGVKEDGTIYTALEQATAYATNMVSGAITPAA